MSGAWTYELTKRAQRDMSKLTRSDKRRIFDALDNLVQRPLSGDIRKLQAKENLWRLRIDPWRILFTPDFTAGKVLVRRVGDRSNIYR